jgi:uncharacterized protein YceK
MRAIALCLTIVVGASGCAAIRASQARNESLEKSTKAHTYSQSCQDVWTAARSMLFGQDYQVKSADAAAGLTLETEWKGDKDGNSSRYMFQGTSPSASQCQVVATKAVKDAQGHTKMDRDWTMEWNLIKQVDMPAAQKYEVQATAAGDAARNAKN